MVHPVNILLSFRLIPNFHRIYIFTSQLPIKFSMVNKWQEAEECLQAPVWCLAVQMNADHSSTLSRVPNPSHGRPKPSAPSVCLTGNKFNLSVVLDDMLLIQRYNANTMIYHWRKYIMAGPIHTMIYHWKKWCTIAGPIHRSFSFSRYFENPSLIIFCLPQCCTSILHSHCMEILSLAHN